MNSFYVDTLYPLQDKVLKIIDNQKTPFYLTGGTALSRGYFGHRFSDDLDLFLNSSPDFTIYAEKIITALQQNFGKIEIILKSKTYYSIKVEDVLKVEFVNDIAFHSGAFLAKDFYSRVDNIQNILSNKLSAIMGRDEPKDIIDIWIITKNIQIDWPLIFKDANNKAVGIFPPEIAKQLLEFPLSLLEIIRWIPDQKPSTLDFKNDLTNICNQILN